jgi:hypothetical protein
VALCLGEAAVRQIRRRGRKAAVVLSRQAGMGGGPARRA